MEEETELLEFEKGILSRITGFLSLREQCILEGTCKQCYEFIMPVYSATLADIWSKIKAVSDVRMSNQIGFFKKKLNHICLQLQSVKMLDIRGLKHKWHNSVYVDPALVTEVEFKQAPQQNGGLTKDNENYYYMLAECWGRQGLWQYLSIHCHPMYKFLWLDCASYEAIHVLNYRHGNGFAPKLFFWFIYFFLIKHNKVRVLKAMLADISVIRKFFFILNKSIAAKVDAWIDQMKSDYVRICETARENKIIIPIYKPNLEHKDIIRAMQTVEYSFDKFCDLALACGSVSNSIVNLQALEMDVEASTALETLKTLVRKIAYEYIKANIYKKQSMSNRL